MPTIQDKPEPKELPLVEENLPPCEKCRSKKFRAIHRIDLPSGGTSIMYECVECGEYRL